MSDSRQATDRMDPADLAPDPTGRPADRAHDPYFDMQPAARPRELDEPELGSEERQLDDPAKRGVPFVEGPFGASPLASELRSDPEEADDRRGETGAMGGVLTGTAIAGPIGGVVGGLIGGTVGAAGEDDDAGDVRDAKLETGEAAETRDAQTGERST